MIRKVKRMKTAKIGVIGCGTISDLYITDLKEMFSNVEVVACADLFEEKAAATAEKYGIRKLTVDDLINDDEVEIVLNLTIPQAHTELNLKALEAGKHVYCEKPLAPTLEEARLVIEKAKEKGLRLGGAPDMFFSAPIQTCRKLLDEKTIGEVTHTFSFVCHPGHEIWHPAPEYYYKKGGGPVLDLGPYHISALVNLLGPVKTIRCVSRKSFSEREIYSHPKRGQKITVEIPTYYTGILEFESGVVCTLVYSFETWNSTVPSMEIHGTEGSIFMPNPGFWGGVPRLFTADEYKATYDNEGNILKYVIGEEKLPFFHEVESPYHVSPKEQKGYGIADMAAAIEEGRPHRTSPEFIYHVLEILVGIDESASSGETYYMKSSCERPERVPEGLPLGEIVQH